MIRTNRKKKIFGKDEEINVELDGSTRKLAEEYTAIQLAVVQLCIDACVPGKLQELKKGMHEALDDAFEAAEKIEGEGKWEAWSNS